MIKTYQKILQYLSSLDSLPFCEGWGGDSRLLLWAFILTLSSQAQDNTQNWVKQIVYKKQTASAIATPIVADANVSLTYFDVFGRPIQQIASKMAVDGNDIVQPIVYDSFGRQSKSYMPYVATTSSMQFTDYSNTDVNSIVAASYPQYANQKFFTQTQFDDSPLNRVIKQAAPGTDWAMGSGHEVKYDYQANTLLGDKVRQFIVNSTGTITELANHADNKLYKTIVYDENTSPLTPNTGIEEFKNMQGQTILKRAYAIDNGNTIATAHDTYNVYDELNNLRYVISPKAADATSLSEPILNNLCYQYKYDYRNRLTEKKEPGKQWQFIVYDELNRIVATGPATNPFGGADTETGWLRTYYDNLNRVCYSGWIPEAGITDASRLIQQNLFKGVAPANASKTTTGTIDGKTVFYTNLNTTGLKLLTVNYYDSYNFPDAPTVFASTLPNHVVFYNNSTQLPRGLPTGSWTRALTTASLAGETAYILYDYRARPIETKNINYLGGFTRTQTKLDFSGKIEYNLTSHSLNTQVATITTKDVFTYSDQDRMLVHTNQVLPSGVIEVLTNNTYSNIGQLINKKLGDIDPTGTNYLQKVDYTYNVRGWLKGINDVGNLTQGTDKIDLFAYKINYNNVEDYVGYTGTKLYNGNISETYWKTSSDNILRKYGYSYDAQNRLLNAVYMRPDAAVKVTNSYNETISYDQNGNIKTLVRNGNNDNQTQPTVIDNLNYVYKPNNNQILWVSDASNSVLSFKNGTNPNVNPIIDLDYEYDVNGNQKLDNNKKITSIKYNHLNLPTEILFLDTNTKITYLYNAAGSKLQKLVQSTATAKQQTDYLGGYQYLKATVTAPLVLQFFPTAEGYINNTVVSGVNKYNYVYNFLDQLGNVRLSYTKNPTTNVLTILEENHYYPYGLKHTNYNANQFYLAPSTGGVVIKVNPPPVGVSLTNVNKTRFNSREYQDELGLNVTATDFRQFDSAIGRFNCIDALSEANYSQSPYHFADGNPVSISDPTGLDGGLTGINSSGSQYANYLTGWASNQAFLNSSLESSSSWGQSSVGGNPIDFEKDFRAGSSYWGTNNSAEIRGIYNFYAGQNGFAPSKQKSTVNQVGPFNTKENWISDKNLNGIAWTLSLNGALGGGFGLDIGLVKDSNNKWGVFLNTNTNVGFGEDVGLNIDIIRPSHSGGFLLKDFRGQTYSLNGGIKTMFGVSGSYGGTLDSKTTSLGKFNPLNYGKSDDNNGYTVISRSLFWGSVENGFMYRLSNTRLLEF